MTPAGTEGRPRLTVGSRRRSRARSAAALAWGLGVFVLIQAALVVALELAPAVRDPEFGLRLSSLRRLHAAEPDRPLVLVLGSSRVSMGVKAAALSDQQEGVHKAPLVFNHSLVGSGPIMELFCLDRLLAQGVRPDLVVVEIWPPLFWAEGEHGEEHRIDVNRLDHRDLRIAKRYSTSPGLLMGKWAQAMLLPCWSHRFVLLSHYAPNWLAWGMREDHKWSGLDAHGWLPFPAPASKKEYTDRVRKAREFYEPLLRAAHPVGSADRALRELVAKCRARSIDVALLYMPEGAAFRSLYSPALNDEIDTYLRKLQRDLRVPFIDARQWIADEDFIDSFHLQSRGAAKFTRRLEREALRPLLEGQATRRLLAAR